MDGQHFIDPSFLSRLVGDRGRFEAPEPIGGRLYARLDDFFKPEIAMRAYREASQFVRYERETLLHHNRLWRAQVGPDGNLICGPGQSSAGLMDVCEVLNTPWFADILYRVTGEELVLLESPKLARMGLDDRIMMHEDNHSPAFRFGVVVHLSRVWTREFGGNLVVGRVRARHPLPGITDFPLPLLRREIAPDRSVLTPKFNSICIFPLFGDVAHGVSTVRVRRQRYALIMLFGHPSARSSSVRDRVTFQYDFPGRAKAV